MKTAFFETTSFTATVGDYLKLTMSIGSFRPKCRRTLKQVM